MLSHELESLLGAPVMTSGRHNDYYWIQWEGAFLIPLLLHVPDIVLGRYLINTSYDSGSITLSDEERQEGWRRVGAPTYSPRITDVRSIPHDQYDEWLVFPQPFELQTWQSTINHCGMSLTDPDYKGIQDELWSQIERVGPESYLAEGARLLFITRNQQLHELALRENELEDWLGPFATRRQENIAAALLTILASGGTLQGVVAKLPAFKAQIESAFDQMSSNAQSADEVERNAHRFFRDRSQESRGAAQTGFQSGCRHAGGRMCHLQICGAAIADVHRQHRFVHQIGGTGSASGIIAPQRTA